MSFTVADVNEGIDKNVLRVYDFSPEHFGFAHSFRSIKSRKSHLQLQEKLQCKHVNLVRKLANDVTSPNSGIDHLVKSVNPIPGLDKN